MDKQLIIEQAQQELSSKGIATNRSNDTLYVIINECELELAWYEIRFQSTLFIEKQNEKENG